MARWRVSTTCCIGKWHFGHTEQYLPRTQGFDDYYGILYSNDMRPVQLVEKESVVEYPVFQPATTQRYTTFIEPSLHDERFPQATGVGLAYLAA